MSRSSGVRGRLERMAESQVARVVAVLLRLEGDAAR